MFNKKEFLRLFWPVLIEQLLATTIGMVNTMMVSGVGVHAISAVSIVDSLNLVILNLFISFSTGATVVIAQLIGAGDRDKATKTASQAMALCVISAAISGLALILFGKSIINLMFADAEELVKANAMIYLVFSGLSYPFLALFSIDAGILRASGNTRSPMRASIIANMANVVAGALCIYVLKLGVTGAGIALLFARITAAGVLTYILANPGANEITVRGASFKIKKDIIGPVIFIGLPNCIDGLIFNGGKLLIQTMITSLGTIALAANGIAGSVMALINIPGNAMSIVAVTVVGQAFGSGLVGKPLRKYFSSLTFFTVILLAAISIVIAPLLPFLLDLYAPPQEVKQTATNLLYMVLVFMPLTWPLAFVLPACIRSTGDAIYITVFSILSMWFVRVLGAWASINLIGWNLMGIWFFWCMDWVVRGIIFIFRSMTSPHVKGELRMSRANK